MKNLTLLIPTYNEGLQLFETISFFLNNFPELKIVVVDDGSTDGSIDLILNLKNILIVRNKENLGKSLAIKSGLQHISTEWVCLFDADLRDLAAQEIKIGFEKTKNEIVDMVVFAQAKDPIICKWLKLDFLLSGERCIRTQTLKVFFATEHPHQYSFEVDFHNWLIKKNKKTEIVEMHSKNKFKLAKWSPSIALKKSWSFYSYLLLGKLKSTSSNVSRHRPS